MHSALKAGTIQLHRKLDSLPTLRGLLHAKLSTNEYCRILAAYAQAHHPIEQQLSQIEKSITLDNVPPFCPRLPSLVSDLGSSRIAFDHLPPPTAAPSRFTEFQEMSHYIGLRYVLEGASQGSQFIAKRLSNMPFVTIQAFSFWELQLQAAKHWPFFCEFINQPAKSVLYEQQAIRAAKTAFQFFIECFSFPRNEYEKRPIW